MLVPDSLHLGHNKSSLYLLYAYSAGEDVKQAYDVLPYSLSKSSEKSDSESSDGMSKRGCRYFDI
jgi:hypothetical protein